MGTTRISRPNQYYESGICESQQGQYLLIPEVLPPAADLLGSDRAVIWLALEPKGVSEHGDEVTRFLVASSVILLAANAGGEI